MISFLCRGGVSNRSLTYSVYSVYVLTLENVAKLIVNFVCFAVQLYINCMCIFDMQCPQQYELHGTEATSSRPIVRSCYFRGQVQRERRKSLGSSQPVCQRDRAE